MLYEVITGATYDCGDFARMLRGALAASDWDGFAARRSAARARGRLYGRGLACYVENTGSPKLAETVQVTAHADGAVTVVSGTQSCGQGVVTSYTRNNFV